MFGQPMSTSRIGTHSHRCFALLLISFNVLSYWTNLFVPRFTRLIHLVSALWIKEEGSRSTPSQEWFTQCGTPTWRSIRSASKSGSRNVSAVYASSSHICHVPPRGLLSAAVWLGPSCTSVLSFPVPSLVLWSAAILLSFFWEPICLSTSPSPTGHMT